MILFTRKRMHCAGVFLSAVVLAVFAFTSIGWADNVITSTLKVTPKFARPGRTVKFEAVVSYNSSYPIQPGSLIRCWVTRHDFSWNSEDKHDIEYPGMGTVTVNFEDGFTIPSDATPGQTFDFYLVRMGWYPMSNKASVKVMGIRTLEKKKTLKHIKEKPVIKKKVEEVPKVKKEVKEVPKVKMKVMM